MKISIIVPFYKGVNLLIDCLDSLIEQTIKDFEVLLILDRPSEINEEMLDAYNKTLNLKILKLEGKEGVAAARNLGLENISGDYAFFLDSDDYLFSDALETLLNAAEEKKAQIVFSKKRNTWSKRRIFLEKEAMKNSLIEEVDEKEDIDDADDKAILKKSINVVGRLMAKGKNIKRISVLNLLICSNLINKHKIRFHEDLIYHSDFPFVAALLFHAETVERIDKKVYIKRKHNDPINLPALSQIKDENMFDDCILAYKHAVNDVSEASAIRIQLDQSLIHYYVSTIIPAVRKSKNKVLQDKYFNIMLELADGISSEAVKAVSLYKKVMIRLLKNKDIEKSLKLASVNSKFHMFFLMFKKPREIKKYLYFHYFVNKPLLDNYVFLETFFGKSYSDNPKYLFEYLNEAYPGKYKYVWVMNKKKRNLPYDAIQVKRFSFRFFYYMARCKYLIVNIRLLKYFVKREGSIVLETWHGTPLKKLIFDMEEVNSASPRAKESFYIQSRSWDYLVSPNRFSSEIFRRAFMYDKEMLEYGYPRNDILHRKDKEQLALKIKNKLKIPADKKVILYAPTWRDDEFHKVGKYKFTLNLDLPLLRNKLAKDYVIILRMHYLVADKLDISSLKGFVYHLSNYDDIAELYLISDILLTDYSSVFFDFANLKRPMLFYMYDIEKYRDILRGFYIDIEEELPGPLLYTSDEVVSAILNIDKVTVNYSEKYEIFYQKYCSLENGKASENIINEVFKLNG